MKQPLHCTWYTYHYMANGKQFIIPCGRLARPGKRYCKEHSTSEPRRT